MPKGRKNSSPRSQSREQKPSRSKNSPLTALFDELKRFWKWLLGLVALAIGLAVTNFINRWEGPGDRRAKIDAILTTAWSDENSESRNKAFLDLRSAARSADDQLFILGRLVYRLRQKRGMRNPSCPNPPGVLGGDEQEALATVIVLSRALKEPRRRLRFFTQAPPQGLADSLRFNSLDLPFANFDGANLEGAQFSNSCLFQPSFLRANLDSTDFTLAQLDSPNFRDAHLRGAKLSIVSRRGEFRGAILTGATLNSARLTSVSFAGADLTCAYFANAVTNRLDMSGVKMPWTLLVADTLAQVESWREIIDMRGAYLVGVVGLTPREIASSRAKGAYVDGLDQEQWAVLRDRNCQNRPKEKGASGAK